MNNFMLLALIGLILTAIVLGVNLALRIVRSIPIGNNNVPVVNNLNDGSNRNGLTSNFSVLLLFGALVIWIVSSQDLFISKTVTPSIVEEAPVTPPQKVLPKTTLENKPLVKTVAFHEIERVNISPIAKAAYDYYTIQVAALETEEKAVDLKNQLLDFPVQILTEGQLHKVLVGEFLTRQGAINYREEHSILQNGFIKRVNS